MAKHEQGFTAKDAKFANNCGSRGERPLLWRSWRPWRLGFKSRHRVRRVQSPDGDSPRPCYTAPMNTLRFVLAAYRRNAWWTFVGIGTSVLGTACQVCIPIFFKLVIDVLNPDATTHRGMASWAEEAVKGLVGSSADKAAFINGCLLWALGFASVLAVMTFYKRYYLIRLSRKVEYEVKRDMYEHLQKLPGRYYDARRSGGIMSLMTSDVENIRMMIGPAIM